MKKVKGKITTWNDEKGYGFITSMLGGDRLFVHIKAFNNPAKRPDIGDVITYCVSKDNHRRPCASEATIVGVKQRSDSTKRPNSRPAPDYIALIFLLSIIAAVWLTALPASVPIVYLVVSIFTFLLYARDKSAAQRGAWRTSENTLHVLAIVGGWPGALVAQNRLRHKSSKQLFRNVFWMTIIVNCLALSWLMTPTGSEIWQSLISEVLGSLP